MPIFSNNLAQQGNLHDFHTHISGYLWYKLVCVVALQLVFCVHYYFNYKWLLCAAFALWWRLSNKIMFENDKDANKSSDMV